MQNPEMIWKIKWDEYEETSLVLGSWQASILLSSIPFFLFLALGNQAHRWADIFNPVSPTDTVRLGQIQWIQFYLTSHTKGGLQDPSLEWSNSTKANDVFLTSTFCFVTILLNIPFTEQSFCSQHRHHQLFSYLLFLFTRKSETDKRVRCSQPLNLLLKCP